MNNKKLIVGYSTRMLLTTTKPEIVLINFLKLREILQRLAVLLIFTFTF